jgi:hypothetical protein
VRRDSVSGVDEDGLLAKLVEAEIRLSPDGQRRSVEACRAQLAQWRQRESDIEYRCSVSNGASQRLFGAVCLRFGIVPYRRSRGTSTICIRAPRNFVREVLWPQFGAMADVVEQTFNEITERVAARWSGVSFDELDSADID